MNAPHPALTALPGCTNWLAMIWPAGARALERDLLHLRKSTRKAA